LNPNVMIVMVMLRSGLIYILDTKSFAVFSS